MSGTSGSDTNALEELPPTRLDVLGDHLYVKVEEVQESFDVELDVAKITGVLLELGEEQVVKLLQNGEALYQSVCHVLRHVPDAVCLLPELQPNIEGEAGPGEKVAEWENDVCGSEEEESLYEQVCLLEPEYSAQITGMLLEMGSARVQSLLSSTDKLLQAVKKAKSAYLSHLQSPQHCAKESCDSPSNQQSLVNNHHDVRSIIGDRH